MNESNFQVANPWVSQERTTSALCGSILLAEKSGFAKTREDETWDEMVATQMENSPSLQLIEKLKQITAKEEQLHKIKLDIHCRLMDKETRDITHVDVLESKISQLDSLTNHIQSVLQNKDYLINRLQRPFVGDYLKIEATYHRHVKELFPLVASCLAELSSNLDTIQWASGFDVKDGKMDEALTVIATSLAQLQTSCQTVCKHRNTLDKF